jgi:hypothetical protein
MKNLTNTSSVPLKRPELPKAGFALVATLSLMILLAILAVGLLSLSAVTLRSSGQGAAQAEARANARMALMVALGELQKHMGPDQRISANGSILSDSSVTHPHWTGAWDSWIAGPLPDSRNPKYPSAVSHHQTIGTQPDDSMRPNYDRKNEHFRSWLVSLNPEEATNPTTPTSLDLLGKTRPGKTDEAVLLVGKGSLGESAATGDSVSARLLPVKAGSSPGGRYGWWVGDESQKARLLHDSYVSTPPASSAEKIFRVQSPASTGTKLIRDLEGLTEAQEARLKDLPTLNNLDLVVGNVEKTPAKRNFHTVSPFSQSVLADVREGGLKRDLSVILEQPINAANPAQEQMLYEFDDPRFNDRSNSRVPIQDLAAYYQLYDNDPSWGNARREGISYNSAALPSAIQAKSPDYDGNAGNRERFQKEYTSMYKQPVIAKVQFLLAIGAQPVTAAERKAILDNFNLNQRPVPMRDTDTHKLRLGVMPMVTLWNPNNVPLVVDMPQHLRFGTPPFAMRWKKFREDGSVKNHHYFNMNYAMGGTSVTRGGSEGLMPHILIFQFARNAASRVVFQPGEVKVFSVPSSQGGTLVDGGTIANIRQTTIFPVNSWNPFGFFLAPNSTPVGSFGNEAPDAYSFTGAGQCMVFGAGDRLALEILTEDPAVTDNHDGRNVSHRGEIYGAGFNLYMLDSYYEVWTRSLDFLRHYHMLSRHGNTKANTAAFNRDLMLPGFPGGVPIPFESETNAVSASQLIAASAADEVIGMLEFTLATGAEAGSGAVGGYGGGRRIASRPFLHSPLNAAPFLDQPDKASLYNFGWDWQIGRINNVEDSIIQAKPGTGNGYHGGGYTVEAGVTHVVQRELPVIPPISIPALKNAHLGGYSLAANNPMGDNPLTDAYWWKSGRMRSPIGTDYQQITATGQGGLAPQVTQAIGNSYAHPNIPAGESFTTKTRLFDTDEGTKVVPFVDHSYLANKALWDEYFFSSMSPQPSKVELFGDVNRTAREVADGFFFGNGAYPLPNRRMSAYMGDLAPSKLDALFAEANTFTNGLGDRIAAHLLVDGAFNVNSTSVEAWKAVLSSLRGKPVAYLETGKTPLESVSSDTTPVNSIVLPNAKPLPTSDITSPNHPPGQWTAGRGLSVTEIEELAQAMVRQVKLRGPFLSMSEFVNRRLDGGNTDEMALKGALQAALDDGNVSINAQFRTPERMLDSEIDGIPFAFPAAAEGPIAYGSQPYVDQADVLLGLAEQLTPRGDTFVIRAYGDSLDASGNVVARAWCEAVVQRTPDYVDQQDENHIRTAALQSDANRRFGRTFNIISFRWLNADEV